MQHLQGKQEDSTEEEEETKQRQRMAIMNEPSPEVFQEVTIYSCVEVVVRITDDIPLLNWIAHFARRFLNKLELVVDGKSRLCILGQEELTSLEKRTIQGVVVCHYDRTRTIVHLTRCGIVEAEVGHDRS